MADSTFTYGSGYGSGSSIFRKRPRTAFEEYQSLRGPIPSKIEDRRVAVSALKLDCDLITINVGHDDQKRSFMIHEDIIKDHTDYFHNQMSFFTAQTGDDLAKEKTRIVELSDHDPEAFALWRTWLYTGKLAVLPETPSATDSSDDRSEHYAVLSHAYILGDYLLDIPFMNAIVDVYVLNARGSDVSRALYPSNEEIGVLYDGTSPDSPIRKFLIDIWMYRGKSEWLDKEIEDGTLPREFLVEVIRELLKLKKNREGETLSRPWKMAHEQYHDEREIAHGEVRDRRCKRKGGELCEDHTELCASFLLSTE